MTHSVCDSAYVISLSVAASWAFARHMDDSERFISAMCSQLGVDAFEASASHDNDVIVPVSQR